MRFTIAASQMSTGSMRNFVLTAILAGFAGLVISSSARGQNCLVSEVKKFVTPSTCQGDANNGNFGLTVAASGDTALVGAPFDGPGTNCTAKGRVHVVQSSAGQWSIIQTLEASDGLGSDRFGASVAVDGSWAVIGAPMGDQAGPTNSGSAYVFRRIGSAWIQQQRLNAPDPQNGDTFGASVAIYDNFIVVGSPLDDDFGFNTGSAYVFQFDGGKWIEVQKLTASDAAVSDQFGSSVAVSAQSLVVGSPLEDDFGPSSGAAYEFGFDGFSWFEFQKITSAFPAAGDEFGRTLAISDEWLAIGAPQKQSALGSVDIFTFNGFWSYSQTLMAGVSGTNIRFGQSVSVRGDVLAVGAPGEDAAYVLPSYTMNGPDAGIGHVYRLIGNTWVQSHKLQSHWVDNEFFANASTENDLLGSAIAIGASVVFAGSPHDQIGDAGAMGSMRIFAINPPDCDANGVPDVCDPDCNHDLTNDACQIAAGYTHDCNANTAPDECDNGFNYVLDSGNGSVVWGLVNAGDYMWMNQFNATAGHQFITHIAVPWTGFTPEGTPCTVLLYSDPNNDGDPNDAALLASSAGVGHDAFGLSTLVTHTIYPIPRTFVGPVGHSFFVGVIVSAPVGVTVAVAESANVQRSWKRYISVQGAIDIHNPAAGGPITQHNANWMIRALAMDCNGNGVYDQCDITQAYSTDINFNGIPDECEPGCDSDVSPPGGDGAVNIDDLVLVITSWGACGSCPADLNFDHVVNIDDLVLVIVRWGPCR